MGPQQELLSLLKKEFTGFEVESANRYGTQYLILWGDNNREIDIADILSPTPHLGLDTAPSCEYFRLSKFMDVLWFLFIVFISSLRFAENCQSFKSNLLMRGLYMESALFHGPIVAKVFTIYFITSICSLLKPDNFLQYL